MLTKQNACDIIFKSHKKSFGKNFEKSQKTFEKGIDKAEIV